MQKRKGTYATKDFCSIAETSLLFKSIATGTEASYQKCRVNKAS